MSCSARSSLGVFVLGALESAESDAVARHLDGCASCRRELAEMAPLPALLATVPAGDAEQLAPPHRRTGLRSRTGIVVVLALLIFLGVGVNLARDAVHAPEAAATVSGFNQESGVRMVAQIAGGQPGTRVAMRLYGVPRGTRCRLVVRTADGRSEVVADWRATYTRGAGGASIDATTSIAAGELSEIAVITEDGRRLLRVPVH